MNAGVKSHRVDEAILEDFEPIDCGEGRSMVVLLGIDYRVSDFGRYHETRAGNLRHAEGGRGAAGLAVRPAVGQRPVLGRADAARLGLPQGFLRRPAVSITARATRSSTPAKGPTRSSSSLCRDSVPAFIELPLVIYSVRNPGADDAIAGSVRTIMERNGAGEGVQVGGTVELQLGRRPTRDASGNPVGHCFCSDPSHPLSVRRIATPGDRPDVAGGERLDGADDG